ncbi:MAG: preprotein translocase subunit SecE [bacterium]
MNLLSKPTKFITDVNHEMSKVSWPSYDELKESTVVVIILSLIFVVFIFLADRLLTELLKLIF